MPSIILRPTSDGTHGAFPWSPTTEPDHYDEVDEVSPDEDTTTISTDESFVAHVDRFNKETLTLPAGATITAVRVYMRCRRYVIFILYPATPYIKEGVTIGASTYYNPNPDYPSDSYSDLYYEWALNPATGLAWTEADVNNAVISCQGISDSAFDPFGTECFTIVLCTQAWIEVVYSLAAAAQPMGDGLTFVS